MKRTFLLLKGTGATTPGWATSTGLSTQLTSSWNVGGIVWNGSIFCVTAGPSTGTGVGRFTTSTNGLTWTTFTTAFSNATNMIGIVWTGSQFCAIGNGTTNKCAYSSSGTSWTSVTGFATAFVGTNVYGMTKTASSTIIVVGGTGSTGAASAYTTNGGVSWTASATIAGQFTARCPLGVAYNGTVYCAVGTAGSCATSSGVDSWVKNVILSAVTASDRSYLIWDGARFVTVGVDTSVQTSTNGTSWSSLGNLPFSPSTGLSLVGTSVYAYGAAGQLAILTSGSTTWTTPSTFTTAFGSGNTPLDAASNGTEIVVVGNSSASATSP